MRYLGPRKNFTLRLPSSLARQLEKIAARDRISVNELICMWLEKETDPRIPSETVFRETIQ